ncbi:Cas10/Cmr2 second palm domain-containing protein [Flavivirga jejuensis]|uniref:Cas10/Cmr2 second palm domain-containing protein n=1 Tax=Flavivirga jejuensis TaxID=870487 RepID=A0ABT8WUT8_9FLAO|nr:hypothetical protein [Flavivirga jejuensis]MDO5976941.1 hypothetical protein [Flavivirga jejuensis]
MKNPHIYGLTVQGIQSYIFSTNKLKEIIGASEIIEQICTRWFFEFIKKNEIEGIQLLNAAGNIRFLTTEDSAKQIFKDFHFKISKKAPGVPFSQAVIEVSNCKNEEDAIKGLDKKLDAQRNVPLQTFDLGVMMRSKNRRTGNFAYTENKTLAEYVDVESHSKLIINKDEISDKIIKGESELSEIKFPTEFEELSKNGTHSWLAVIHIDGNGMGNIIKRILSDTMYSNKFDTLSEFSKKIGDATLNAFRTALKSLDIKNAKYMRPIIIGGDDVTLIIRADFALKFTQNYLTAFEKNTKDIILGVSKITACAGIAYVKEKFPFHYAVHLAEELCSYAKNKSERKFSCVQFHKVNDSIIEVYKDIIKEELTTSSGEKFVNGPYGLQNENSIAELIKNANLLKENDAPTNSLREYIDACFNDKLMKPVFLSRLKAKLGIDFNNLLENETALYDYLALHAVNSI